MTTLSEAIELKQWELAALLLALAYGRAVARLPAGTMADLLAVLEEGESHA